MPYNSNGKRKWLSFYEYHKLYPNEYEEIFFDIQDYRKDENTCKWCGGPLKNKRQKSYCSDECKYAYQSATTWQRGVSPLAYRILCRDNFTCQKCGEVKAITNQYGMMIPAGREIDVHHKIPVSEGGSDHISNLISLCRECHKNEHRRR